MIQSGNWRGARDRSRELEGHVIQSGDWKGARDRSRELEGARDTVWELERYTWTSQGTKREHVR